MATKMPFATTRLAAAVLTAAVLLGWSTPALADQAASAPTEAARAELAKKVVAIAQLRPFDPRKAASILGGRLGPAVQSTEYNTKRDITAAGPLLTATVTKTPKETSVTIRPAASVGLTFQDLESLLLDYPHEIEIVNAHFNEVEQRAIAVRHWFQVPAGTLGLEVGAAKGEPFDERKFISEAYAAARGQASQKSLVKTIMLGDRSKDDEDRPPTTLRSRRSRAAGKGKPGN